MRKTYKELKAEAVAEAIATQQEQSTSAQSWAEVATTCEHFQKLAKKYGLIKEFKREGII